MGKRKKTQRVLSPMQALRRAERRAGKAAKVHPPEVSADAKQYEALQQLLNVWPSAGIDQEPCVEMVRWRVFAVNGDRVVCGYSMTKQWGRRSTPIVAFNPKHMRVRTASGRIYQLKGPPGWDADAEHVLDQQLHALLERRRA